MDIIVLKGIPLPPSVNHQYKTVMVGGKLMRVPSKEYKQYKKDFAAWAMLKKNEILVARQAIIDWNSTLEVSMYCCFEQSRLITKDGRCKNLDISNRSKALHDLLSEALQINDSTFVSTPMEKVLASLVEEAIIVIKPFSYRYSNDLKL